MTSTMTPLETDERVGYSVYSWPCSFNDFSKLPDAVGEFTSSAPFKIGRYEFKVQVYPGGRIEDCKQYVSVFLKLCQPSHASIKFTQSVLLNTEKLYYKDPGAPEEFNLEEIDKWSFGWDKFVKRTSLFTDVLAFTNDQVIILTEFFNLDVSVIPNHLQKLRNYDKYVNNQELSDVKIFTGGKTIFAHKVVLTSGNKVFSAMFTHDLKENEENVINIEDIKFEVMLELVRSIYTGQVRNIERMPKELLIAADKYGEQELKDYCGEYLCQLLSVHNVLELLNFAEKYKVDDLRSEAMTFFLSHRKDVARTREFKSTLKQMDPDLIIEILGAVSQL